MIMKAKTSNNIIMTFIQHIPRNLAFSAHNGLPADLYSDSGGSPKAVTMEFLLQCLKITGWFFQICFYFQPYLGKMIQVDS